jgi:hypothetical protein
MSKHTFDEVVIKGTLNGATAAEVGTLAGLTATVEELNILDTVTATAAEINLLDQATIANSVASKAAILDGSKRLVTNANVGTAGTNVTAVELGDGAVHTTILTLSSVAITIGDAVDLGTGALIYTLPAGVQFIDYAYMTVALTADDVANQTDTPEVGLGTVIASGAVATLGTTPTFEDIIEGAAVADANGTAKVIADIPTANVPLVRLSGDAKTIHLNYADGWADGTVQTATASGTIVLKWTHLA